MVEPVLWAYKTIRKATRVGNAMLPQRSLMRDHKNVATSTENRIRLLSNLADALAELGLVEETLEACKAITRLRMGVASIKADLTAPAMTLQPIET